MSHATLLPRTMPRLVDTIPLPVSLRRSVSHRAGRTAECRSGGSRFLSFARPSLTGSTPDRRGAQVSGERAATRRGAARLSLTRRGRFVFIGLPVLVASVLALVGGMLMLASGSAQAGTEHHGTETREVTVVPGDTLWDIARDAAPEEDPRNTMEQIKDLNGLQGEVSPGQRLIVPEIS